MATQADKEHTDGPYSVRWLDAASKRDAKAAAARASLDVGEWWALAARTQLAFERGELVHRTDDGIVDGSRALTLIDEAPADRRFSVDEAARVVEIAGHIANLRGRITDRALTALLAKAVSPLGLTAADLGDRPLARVAKAIDGER
jgi:hypothetical protein